MQSIELLEAWLKLPQRRFGRVEQVDQHCIEADCSGLLNLLIKALGKKAPFQLLRPKAVHYYALLQEIGSPQVAAIRAGHFLAWRKDVVPKSGDTGHVLIAASKARQRASGVFVLDVLDSTKASGGLARREVELHADQNGRLIGVRLHLSDRKVKRVPIFHACLERSRHCFGCALPKAMCMCGKVEPQLSTPSIVILRHPSERGRTLSTVSLIKQRYPGVLVKDGELFSKPRDMNLALLFPGAEPLNIEVDKKGLEGQTRVLVLIDATWPKARKILHLNTWLAELPKVSLEPRAISDYLIRKVPDEDSLSTVESFALVARDLELSELFRSFVEQQITVMGEDIYRKNYRNHLNFRP